MRRRDWYYLIDVRSRKGSARGRVPFRWLADLACHLNHALDYGKPGTFL